MQPYFFPYLSYFHLIESSDIFIFYTDVQYIHRGWINRNRILLKNKAYRFTIPVERSSQNSLIQDKRLSSDSDWSSELMKKLEHAYGKAPYFDSVMCMLEQMTQKEYTQISELAIASIHAVYTYLDLSFNHSISSEISPENRTSGRAERLIEITKKLGYSRYINSSGGRDLYQKEFFRAHGVELAFIQSKPMAYPQFNKPFIPELSIIDVLMFNSPEQVRNYLSAYTVT